MTHASGDPKNKHDRPGMNETTKTIRAPFAVNYFEFFITLNISTK